MVKNVNIDKFCIAILRKTETFVTQHLTMEVFQINFCNNKANLRKMCLLNMKIVVRLHFLNEISLNNPKVL